MGFNHGIEEKNVRILGLGKDANRIWHLVESPTNGDEMGKNLIGLVKAMAEEMGVDLSEMHSSFVAVKKTQDLPLDLTKIFVHLTEKNGIRHTEKRKN